MFRAALLLACLVLVGCESTLCDTSPRAAPTPDIPTPAYYDSPGPVPEPTTMELEYRQPLNERWKVTFPARVHPEVSHVRRVKDPIELFWIRARPIGGKPRPLVVMIPILANGTFLMFEIASGYSRMGYDVAVVPRKELDFDPIHSIDEAEAESRATVMRAKQTIDWLAAQPGIDSERIGFFGISAGGIVGASLAAADPRIKAQVLVFAGAPMADVMTGTVEDSIADSIKGVMETRKWSRERVRAELRSRLRTDPYVLAPRISRENTLMFIAHDDESVPTRTQYALWYALGRPKAHRVPGGHYVGVGLFLPAIISQSQRFLGQRLGAP